MEENKFTFDNNEIELEVLKKTINTLNGKLTTFENKKNEMIEKANEVISNTVCAKRQEIETTYREVLTEAEKRLATAKTLKVEERKKNIKSLVDKNTREIKNNNVYLNNEIKRVLKEAKIPSFVNSEYYFSVWSPYTVKQVFVGLLTWVIIFLIPTALCFLIYKKRIEEVFTKPLFRNIIIVLIYLAFLLIFGLIWLFIDKLTKKDKEALEKVKEYRKNINDNEKEIRKITEKINKETTDEQFDYTKLDRDIEAGQIEVENYRNKLKEALENFSNTTEKEIKDKINNEAKKDIDAINIEIEKIKKEISNTQTRYDELKLKICDNKVNGNSI